MARYSRLGEYRGRFMGQYLFSFVGRVNRAKLWLFLLIILAFEIVAGIAVMSTLGLQNIMDVADGSAPLTVLTGNGAAQIVCAIVGLGLLALLYAGLAVAAKRLHDRNKSGWWLLVFYLLPFVLNFPRQIAVLHAMADGSFMRIAQHGGTMALGGPLATILGGIASLISLWAFVELYCLRGTAGDNRFGSDPLAPKG
jgi:uncharacterized membrane protein YhaH (DUF805 family)